MTEPLTDGIPRRITIAIPDHGLLMTRVGLSYALAHLVPHGLKNSLASQGAMYSWTGRSKDDRGNKWLLINVEYWEKLP